MTFEEIIAQDNAATFGGRLIVNTLRGRYIESAVTLATPTIRRMLPVDCWGWDACDPRGLRLEVKHAAALQAWPTQIQKCSFKIAGRREYFDPTIGGKMIPTQLTRYAQIHIFAHHPRDDGSADQREIDQWDFYLVATGELPEMTGKPGQAISLLDVRHLARRRVGISELGEAVGRLQKLIDPVPLSELRR